MQSDNIDLFLTFFSTSHYLVSCNGEADDSDYLVSFKMAEC